MRKTLKRTEAGAWEQELLFRHPSAAGELMRLKAIQRPIAVSPKPRIEQLLLLAPSGAEGRSPKAVRIRRTPSSRQRQRKTTLTRGPSPTIDDFAPSVDQ
jgi:hypothetical protein